MVMEVYRSKVFPALDAGVLLFGGFCAFCIEKTKFIIT
jgi:hypothetical protein